MVKLTGAPVHVKPLPVYDGVAVMVAVIACEPVLTATKEAIFPLPPAASPIEGAEFVQLKTVPVTGPLKLMAAVGLLWQTTWLFTVSTAGAGFTVMVYPDAIPAQPLAVGVIIICATIGPGPGLVAVKPGMLPVPEAPRPMPVLLLVHEKRVPETGPVNGVAGAVAPLQ